MDTITMTPALDEELLWQDAREAERRIESGLEDAGRTIDQVFDEYLILGKLLTELRRDRSNPQFSAACGMQRIKASRDERTAAIWWASRNPGERDTLREENPATQTLVAMRDRCRESHPGWAQTLGQKPKNSIPRLTRDENKPAPEREARPAPRPEPAKKLNPKTVLSAKEIRSLQQEEARKIVRRQAEAKYTRAAANAGSDPRQSVAATTGTVIAYGEQLWPKPAHRHEYADYDQLYWGCAQFHALLGFIPAGSPKSRAIMVRQVLRASHRFVERRLREDKGEMMRFLGVITLLCHLYESNPSGQCVWPPQDIASYKEAKEARMFATG